MFKKGLLACMMLMALVGCATQLTDDMLAELNTPLSCKGEAECKLMWDRAMAFVVAAPGVRVQMYNDMLIESYNPVKDSPTPAFRVYKIPISQQEYKINIISFCNNMFGCRPSADFAISVAKKYIRTGVMTELP